MKIRRFLIDYLPMALTAILIVFFSVVKQQSIVKTLPTLITLFVQILLSRANRFGFLLGAVNSLIYGIAYLGEGLYFSFLSATLISAPIQTYSFFNWSKQQTSAGHTELKLLGMKKRIVVIMVTLAAWMGAFWGLAGFFANAQLPWFDSFHFSVGIIVSFLAAFRYVESQYLNTVSCCSSIVMWTLICVSSPSNVNYLIISCYNLFMLIKSSVHWTKQYIQDQKRRCSEHEL